MQRWPGCTQWSWPWAVFVVVVVLGVQIWLLSDLTHVVRGAPSDATWPRELEIVVDAAQRRVWHTAHRTLLPMEESAVNLRRYHDDTSRRDVYLPPAHYDWIMKVAAARSKAFDPLTCVPLQVEKPVMEFFRPVTCSDSAALMLDVGMNDGIYGLLGAARGCRVYAFELQQQCTLCVREHYVH